jgi:formate dehydrogenase major subunit
MFDAADAGKLKALWAIGYDVALTNPNTSATLKSLQSMEFVVVQDLFLTETARAAGSVFLPACSSFEKDGTFMNSERRIQRVRKVIEPIGQSRPDWEILCHVAQKMDRGKYFGFRSAEEIWNEIRSVWPAGAGITYARLERGGLQWPCPTDDHPGTTILHADAFSDNRRFALRHIKHQPTPEQTSAEFPLLLVTGRALYHFNAGTMTGRAKTVHFQANDSLHISPEDARALGVATGQHVRVRSHYGTALLPAIVTSTVMPGQVFATFQSSDQWINRVTSLNRDRFVSTPEYKVTAVQVESVDIS